VDEIERSFNKNLAQNLILLFNDKAINIKNATLVYTTHYAELLDDDRRLDNINVLHRHGDQISLKNLHKDYDLNIQLSKSNYFEQNAFDSLLNYNSLMELRRAILP
jgi:AAA15 family ATPase/GTPase